MESQSHTTPEWTLHRTEQLAQKTDCWGCEVEEKRPKLGLRGTEEKATMRAIGERDKKPNLMSSEKQVARAMESNVKVKIAHVENDDSTTVDNGLQFERGLVRGKFLTEHTYKVLV